MNQKIFIKTLVQFLIILSLIFVVNNWALIKQSFNGSIADLPLWFQSFKLRQLLLIGGLTAYFYYRSMEAHKVKLKQSEVV